MFPKGRQTRKHCFLAMFLKGGQTRKHCCFLATLPKGGQTRKHCFLAMFLKGRQTRRHCLNINRTWETKYVSEDFQSILASTKQIILWISTFSSL